MKHAFCFLTLLCLSTINFAQIAPPYFTTAAPSGGERGKKVTLTVEGFNLTGASEVLWSKAGISAVIVTNVETAHEKPRPSTDPTKKYQGDNVTRNRVTLDVTIAPDAETGLYRFRLKTPLGTTNLGAFYVTALRETMEAEANNTLSDAQAVMLPTTVVGEMNARGDRDHFKFSAQAGQQLIFEIVASALGAKFDGVLTLFDATGKQLATNNDYDFRRDPLLAYGFKQDGEYVLRVTDFEQQGMSRTHEFDYRLNLGALPYVSSIFPLGLQQGTRGEFAVSGFNLGATQTPFTAPALVGWNASAPLALKALNAPRLAIGTVPETLESNAAKSLAAPQIVTLPITINGKLAETAEDFYRFTARKGETLMLEIGAQRFGSPLDAVIEIYDAKGQLVPRALLRSVSETQQTLNDRDSSASGLRVLNWSELAVNDFILIGNEVLQIDVLPKGPDEDTRFKNFNGQRLGFFDTTPEAHAVYTPMYKVTVHPPDAKLPPNGLPQTMLYFRNDDGGPMYGKDSRMTFTAPADGAYTVRVRDVRGQQGERFAYRLTIRPPQPDFVLSIDPENANIPHNVGVLLTARAFRTDEWQGDIAVKLIDLPARFTATEGVIRVGEYTTQIWLKAEANATTNSFSLKLRGEATINSKQVVREANTSERISVASLVNEPEVLVWTEQESVTLSPDRTAWVNLKIKRQGEFKGRVLFEVRNLPHGVIVKDVGLSGVMIPEDETTQRFELEVAPWVKPQTLTMYVVARIDSASPQRIESPARPLSLKIEASNMTKK
ncbi:MAG: hypothetical protein HOP19_18155 [Acidobacteria bacterium]|nr:hypothetical protein [Acidobacteriota bacterium]